MKFLRPKIAGIFLVRPITPKHLFQDSRPNQAIEQRLRSEDTDFAAFGIVPPCSINVRPSDDRDQCVRRAYIGDAATPADLPTAVFKSIGDMGIAGDQRSGGSHWHQPFQGVVSIYVEGAGKNIFLIEGNVSETTFLRAVWAAPCPRDRRCRHGTGFGDDVLAGGGLQRGKRVIAATGGRDESPCKHQYLE
jgi:hypothetical protein